MAAAATMIINRTWVVAELLKLVEAERSMAGGIGARSETPPDESLSFVYHEIATADERHAEAIETIATRYGLNPSRNPSGGFGEAIGRLKDRFAALGSHPIERLLADMSVKAEAIHRYSAWVHAFEAAGDAASAGEIAAILADEQVHRDALQAGLDRLIEQATRSE
jgi:bacterioferritin (cytochrome b1)